MADRPLRPLPEPPKRTSSLDPDNLPSPTPEVQDQPEKTVTEPPKSPKPAHDPPNKPVPPVPTTKRKTTMGEFSKPALPKIPEGFTTPTPNPQTPTVGETTGEGNETPTPDQDARFPVPVKGIQSRATLPIEGHLTAPQLDWVQKITSYAWEGNLEQLQQALRSPYAYTLINHPNDRGQTALFCAASQGHVQIVVELCNYGPIDIDVRVKGGHGGTPLHAAGFHQHEEVVAVLLFKGANPNISNNMGLTARQDARGQVLSAYAAFDGGDHVVFTSLYPILLQLKSKPPHWSQLSRPRTLTKSLPNIRTHYQEELAALTQPEPEPHAPGLLPISISSPKPQPQPPPKPTEAPPCLPMQPAVDVIVKTGWLLINKQSPKRFCELKNSCQFSYYAELGCAPLDTLSLQFKYHVIPDDLLLRRKSGPVTIQDEVGQIILTLEYDTFDDMEDWVRVLETLNNRLVNKVMRPVLNLRKGWLHHSINIWNGSWNVGNTPPQSLDDWLTLDSDYDLVVVGAQECSYKLPTITTINSEDWYNKVIETINRKNSTPYYVVSSLSLLEIRLIIFAKKVHEPFITQVRTSSVATGIANVVGNKGGVGISFSFHCASLIFITSHLAAHQDMIDRRNQDYKEVVKRMRMGNNEIDITNRFQYMFWSGDLNYRIDLPFDTVMDMVYKTTKIPTPLLDADQLIIQMRDQKVFEGFSEMPITFWPTYRLLRGGYDNQKNRIYNDEKQRIPSWCDRVLSRPFPDLTVTPGAYYSVPTVDTSDHCPIVATCSIDTAIAPGVLYSSLREDTPLTRCFAVLQFTQLKAKGMKWTEEPSAYIRFYSKVFPSHLRAQTAPDPHTYSPSWGDYELQLTGVPNLGYLESSHVILEVLSGKIRPTSLGQAVLSLAGCPKRFNEPILLNGETVAYMAGSISLQSQAANAIALETFDAWAAPHEPTTPKPTRPTKPKQQLPTPPTRKTVDGSTPMRPPAKLPNHTQS